MPFSDKFWIEQFKKAGVLPAEREGVITETLQAAGNTALQVGKGIGSTVEETTGDPSMRQFFQEKEAANPQWRPDQNYSPSSLHPADIARTVSTGVTQSAMSLGAGVVGGAIGGAPGAAVAMTAGMMSQTYGERVKEYREAMPGADDGVIKGWAFLSSLGESLIETVAGPEQMVAGAFKGIVKQALNQTTRQLIKMIGKEAAKSAIAEGSEEVCQMYWDNVVRMAAGQNVELQPFSEVRDTFMGGALPGAFMGGVGGGVSQAMRNKYGQANDYPTAIDPAAAAPGQQAAPAQEQQMDPALQVVQGLSEQLKVPIRFMTEAEVQQNAKTDENGNPVSVNGFYDTAKSEIVLNPNGELSVEQAFGHELKHFLNVHHPDLVETFDSMAQQNLTEKGQQELADTGALYGQAGNATEEFNADWFARLAMDPEALREAAIMAESRSAGFGKKLIDAVTEFLKMVMDTARKIGTPQMEAVFNNAKEVRSEAIRALSDFNQRQNSQLVKVEQASAEMKQLPGRPERKLLPAGKPADERTEEEQARQKKLLEAAQYRSDLEQRIKERQGREKVYKETLRHEAAMRKIDKHLAKFNKFGSDAMDDEAFRRANTEELDRIEAAIRKGNPQLVREGLDRLAKRVKGWKRKGKPVSVSTKTETESGSKPVVEPKKLPFVAPEAQAPTTQDVVTTTPNVVPAKKLPFVAPQAEPVETPVEAASTQVEAAPGGVVRVNTNEIHVDPKRFQFKSGTNPITGVDESNKVGGEWDPKSAGLVYVWEDKDGKKFIVNGHHRLQLAKELNVPMLNAIVDREVDGVSQEEARRQGVLTNIRDGQGRVEDYATFVRGDKSMDEAAARKEGITSRAAGQQGFMIGRYAGEELYGAFKAGDITGAKAAAIAEAGKGDPATQIAGMKKAKEMSAEQLREFLKILKRQQREQKLDQLDLFGFDDSAIKMSEDISKLAIKKLKAISDRVLTVQRAVRKPDVAQQGDVKVGGNAQKLYEEALQEQARWEHYETDHELYQQLVDEAGYGKKEEDPAPAPAPPPVAVAPTPAQTTQQAPANPDNPLGLDGFDNMFSLFSESAKDKQKADKAKAKSEAKAAEINRLNLIAKTPALSIEQQQEPAKQQKKKEDVKDEFGIPTVYKGQNVSVMVVHGKTIDSVPNIPQTAIQSEKKHKSENFWSTARVYIDRDDAYVSLLPAVPDLPRLYYKIPDFKNQSISAIYAELESLGKGSDELYAFGRNFDDALDELSENGLSASLAVPITRPLMSGVITEEQIRNSGMDNGEIARAVDFLNGNRNFVNEIAYQRVKNQIQKGNDNVRGVTGNMETNPGVAGEASPVDVAGGGVDNGRGSGRPGVRNPEEATGEGQKDGGRQGPSRESGPAGDDVSGAGAGAGGYRGVQATSPDVGRGDSGGVDAERGGHDGRNGTPDGGRSSNPSSGKPGNARIAGKTVAERIDQAKAEQAKAVEKLKAALDKFNSGGNKNLSLTLVGLSNDQVNALGEILVASAHYGYALAAEGFYRLEDWAFKVKERLGGLFTENGIPESELDELIRQIWDSKHTLETGETKRVSEWAEKFWYESVSRGDKANELQRQAESIPVKQLDFQNIVETLPKLLPEQQEDVYKTEVQFFDPSHNTREYAYGKGMLFTNGTGTGKTYTGLGIAKRFIRQGKDRILVVTPSQEKVKDWIDDASNLLIPLRRLNGTKDKGQGPVVTTFANFRANQKLAEDVFDLVIYDESHRIMENKDGEASATTTKHHMMANRNPQAALLRMKLVHPLWIEYNKVLNDNSDLRKTYKINEPEGNSLKDLVRANNHIPFADLEKLHKRLSRLAQIEWEQKKILPDMEKQAEEAAKKTKVVFLSATPFNTIENLQYAVEYTFMLPEVNESTQGGFDHHSPWDQFKLDNFGARYRWRYHRVEEHNENPEAASLQEVMFADKLLAVGVHSTRLLNSEFDYSREFPLVTGAYAPLFNKGLASVMDFGVDGAENPYSPLRNAFGDVFYDYNYATALFETLKTAQTIPYIEQLLEQGKKVVIFHRRVQGNVEPPFAKALQGARLEARLVLGNQNSSEQEKNRALDTLAAADSFEEEYASLLEYEQTLDYRQPIQQVKNIFGERAVAFNGNSEYAKEKKTAVKKFNDDNSGVDVFMVQEDAGKEGISLHDTTGKHPRVLINMALPNSPITFLQAEGRTYRIGNQSNARFVYPMLGLDLEIFHFGSKVNKRVSTTENLSMGSQGRDMLLSIANGVLYESGEFDINGDGVGGKERDRRQAGTQATLFDRAVAQYYNIEKNNKKRDNREGKDYYATPEPLGYMMGKWGGVKDGDAVLEPSAGHGALVGFLPSGVKLTAIEPSMSLAGKLHLVAPSNSRIIKDTFESHNIINKYDLILTNPPFGHAGSTALKHIEKAFRHLEDGGRIVAILPSGAQEKLQGIINSTNEKGKHVYPDIHLRRIINLPGNVFQRAGTSVNTFVAIIDKTESTVEELSPYGGLLEHREDKTLGAFFDSLKQLEDLIPPRPPKREKKAQEHDNTTVYHGQDVDFTWEVLDDGGDKKSYLVKKIGYISNSLFARIHQKSTENKGRYSRRIGGFIFADKLAVRHFLESVGVEDLKDLKYSLSRQHRQVNPIMLDGEVRSADEESAEANASGTRYYSLVRNPKTIKRLENEKHIKAYRAAQVGPDGKLYSPMAGMIGKEWGPEIVLGEWEQADERPELAKPKAGKGGNVTYEFTLNKGNGSSITAAYNPYIHSSRSPLNDQFSSAYKRPNLVTLEVLVPESELTSGYKAEKAKDAVGELAWKTGPVASKLQGDNERKVILSRWDKPLRIVPESEVAKSIASLLQGENIAVPENVVTPKLRDELEKLGVPIERKFSLSKHRQVNPIMQDGEVRDEYRSWLENGRYTPEQVSEWYDKALAWVGRQGGPLKAAQEFAEGAAPAGKIGTMAAKLIMNSREFSSFDLSLRKAVADQYIFQGSEWGREGVARRLASLTLDTLEKAQVFFDRLTAKMEQADRDRLRDDVEERTGIDIDNLPNDIVNDPAKLDEVLRAALASSAAMKNKVREYWINAILSGPQTHAANMIGNVANAVYELGPKRLAEVVINLAAKRKTGATIGEFKAMTAAFSWKAAWEKAKIAFDQEVLSDAGKVEGPGVAIEGKHGRVIRLPGRLLRAADEFAKAIIAPVEAAAYAYREAKEKNLSEEETRNYIERQIAKADSLANLVGTRRATELTFQEAPGAAVQHLISLREKGGMIGTILQYFLPFIKTPTNLLRQGVRKSPLGAVNLAGETIKLLQGKRQLDNDYIGLAAEQLLAWGAVAMFLGMDDDDDRPILTGTGAGQSLNERSFKAGKIPSYSIRVGDQYISYRRIEPLASGLALIADGMAAYRETSNGKAMTAAIKDMIQGATMIITEKSYLNSLDQLHQFLTDPERGIEQWGTSFLASWIPNVSRQTINTMDNNLRDYRSRARGGDWWKEQFFHAAGKAGFVKVSPKIDYFGREVTKSDAENASPGADLWKLISPVAIKPAADMEKADLLLWNYNRSNPDKAYWPSLPNYTFERGRERLYFAGEDYTDFAAEAGKLAHKQINFAIRRGLLNVNKPTDKDIDLIKRIFTRARKETRDKFYSKKRFDRASSE